MSSITAFLFMIGVLVFAHELGHFLIAKWCGVRVEKFSLGFGPALIGFTYGETEYKICVLPLGGYVKMSGEGNEPAVFVENTGGKTPFEKGDRITFIEGISLTPQSRWGEIVSSLRPNPGAREVVVERNDSEVRLKAGYGEFKSLDAYFESEYPRSFSKKSVARRMSIVTAGPVMNFALPFILVPLAFMAGISVPSYTESEPVVRVAAGKEESGIRKGDRIVVIDGKRVEKWSEVSSALRRAPADVPVEIERNGRQVSIKVPKKAVAPELVAEPREAVVDGVANLSPAHKAGLESGDKITALDGKKIRDWDQMARIIRQNGGKELELSVVREGKTVKTSVVPVTNPGTGAAVIGITMRRDETLKKFGLVESITEGTRRAAQIVTQTVSLFFSLLFSLIGGKISLGEVGKTVAGPLFIAKMSGAVAQQGISSLLIFASFISVNLAVVNLLPIPVLDGGHVVYLTIESVRGKPLSRSTLETAQRVGFSFLIAIMLIATYNDISNLWEEITGWFGGLGRLIG